MRGKISLVLSNEIIDFEAINRQTSLKASKIIHRGQKLALNHESKEDRWIYSLDFSEEDFEQRFSLLLEELEQNWHYIKSIRDNVNVELNVYLNSQMGQFGFVLGKENIEKLQRTGLEISFHILSFGLVE